MLYGVIQGNSINVGCFIYNWMKKIDYGNEWHDLPYPSNINGLRVGVARLKTDTVKKDSEPINDAKNRGVQD